MPEPTPETVRHHLVAQPESGLVSVRIVRWPMGMTVKLTPEEAADLRDDLDKALARISASAAETETCGAT